MGLAGRAAEYHVHNGRPDAREKDGIYIFHRHNGHVFTRLRGLSRSHGMGRIRGASRQSLAYGRMRIAIGWSILSVQILSWARNYRGCQSHSDLAARVRENTSEPGPSATADIAERMKQIAEGLGRRRVTARVRRLMGGRGVRID